MDWNYYFDDIGTTLRWRVSYHRVKAGAIVKAVGGGYLQFGFKGKSYSVHRVLYEMRNGPILAGLEVDHIDGNKLNNLPSNLRLATKAQNHQNRKRQANNTSGLKGVYFDTSANMWRGETHCLGKRYRTAYKKDKNEASAELIRLREMLHKEFANHG